MNPPENYMTKGCSGRPKSLESGKLSDPFLLFIQPDVIPGRLIRTGNGTVSPTAEEVHHGHRTVVR